MVPEELLRKLGAVTDERPILSPKVAAILGGAPPTPARRILVIDDHPLLRKKLQPDLVLLDLNMPELDGLETLTLLKGMQPPPKVAILTVSDAREDVVAAMRGGADGYLLKDTDPEEILDKIRELLDGHLVMSPKIAEILARAMRSEAQQGPGPEGLTEREHEILLHISGGESNKLIARKLGIAEATVKVHVKHLLKKLGLKTRVEAAVWAVNHKYQL